MTLVTLDEALAKSVAQPRFAGTMLAIFSWVALTLAMMGIFSVISFSVAQQTREIGIRMALGAQPRDILRMVLARGVALDGGRNRGRPRRRVRRTRVLASLLYSAASPIAPACTRASPAARARRARCDVPRGAQGDARRAQRRAALRLKSASAKNATSVHGGAPLVPAIAQPCAGG